MDDGDVHWLREEVKRLEMGELVLAGTLAGVHADKIEAEAEVERLGRVFSEADTALNIKYDAMCERAEQAEAENERLRGVIDDWKAIWDYCSAKAVDLWTGDNIPQALAYADVSNRIAALHGVAAEEDEASEHTAGDAVPGGVGDPGSDPGD